MEHWYVTQRQQSVHWHGFCGKIGNAVQSWPPTLSTYSSASPVFHSSTESLHTSRSVHCAWESSSMSCGNTICGLKNWTQRNKLISFLSSFYVHHAHQYSCFKCVHHLQSLVGWLSALLHSMPGPILRWVWNSVCVWQHVWVDCQWTYDEEPLPLPIFNCAYPRQWHSVAAPIWISIECIVLVVLLIFPLWSTCSLLDSSLCALTLLIGWQESHPACENPCCGNLKGCQRPLREPAWPKVPLVKWKQKLRVTVVAVAAVAVELSWIVSFIMPLVWVDLCKHILTSSVNHLTNCILNMNSTHCLMFIIVQLWFVYNLTTMPSNMLTHTVVTDPQYP